MADDSSQREGDTALAKGGAAPLPERRQDDDIAREWLVSLPADEVKVAVHGQPGVVRRSSKSESALEHSPHEGQVFAEPREDGIVLWQRPRASWRQLLRGTLQPTPYPDMLQLRVRETAHGRRVVASWVRHPATRDASIFVGVTVVMTLVMVAAVLLLGQAPWIALILPLVLGLEVARFRERHVAKRDLLALAHAALAPHERGMIERDASAFRADPLSPDDQQP